MRLLRSAACLLVISVSMGHVVHAQVNQGAIAAPAYRAEVSVADDLQRQETVTTRAHPETDPLGIDLNGWQVLPSVATDEAYNDNIYATNTGALTDYVTTVSPEVLVRSTWSNSLVTFDVNSQNGFYATHTTENFNDYSATGTGRLDISRQEYIAVKGGYYFLHEPRTSPNNNFGTTPTTYGLPYGQLEYYKSLNRVSFTLDGITTRYIYSDVGNGTGGFIANTDRTRTEYTGSGRLGYELQPLMEVFIKGEGIDRFYDHKFGTDGYQRSSTGYDVTSGVTMDLGGITFGEIGVGYMQRSYYDSRFSNIGGVTANISLTWNATPITTVKAAVQRSIEETIEFGSPGFVATAATLSVDHELLRSLLLNAAFGVNYNDYKDVKRSDTIGNGAAGATYLLNRYAKLSIKFNYRHQDSTAADLGFRQNLALVRLTLQM